MKSKLIKYLGFIIVFLSISAFSQSQVTKLKTVSVSFKNLGLDGKWGEWEDESESSVLITFDESKDRFTIYSSTTQIFDVANYLPKSEDKNGNTVLKYFCIDKDGVECYIRYIHFLESNSSNNLNQFYIDYSDFIVAFDVYALD